MLLDRADTAVTDATCFALLSRADSLGVRIIAAAVATAPDPEYLDHIHGQVVTYLLPDGPIDSFIDICTELANDQASAVGAGAQKLLQWAQPWSTQLDTR